MTGSPVGSEVLFERDLAWVGTSGELHVWVYDGTISAYVHYSDNPWAKRYVLSEFDVDESWPEFVLESIELPSDVRFDVVLSLRADERLFAQRVSQQDLPDCWNEFMPTPELTCFYSDEIIAARVLGIDLGMELGLFNQQLTPYARGKSIQ